MKKIVFLVCLFLVKMSFGQYDRQEFEHPFGQKDTIAMHYIGGADNLGIFLSGDHAARKMIINDRIANETRKVIVYLDGATDIWLKAEFMYGNDRVKPGANYRINIIENDTNVLVKDMLVKDKKFLGYFDIRNKTLTVTVQNMNNHTPKEEIIIYNKPLKPVKIVEAHLTEVVSKTQTENRNMLYDGPITIDKKWNYAEIAIAPTDLISFYSVVLIRNEKNNAEITHLHETWFSKYGNLAYRIDKQYFSKSGAYTLYIFPNTGDIDLDKMPPTARKIKFTLVKPIWYKDREQLLSIVLAGLVLTLLSGSAFWLYSRQQAKRQKQKLAEQEKQKNIAKWQLSSVRAQLNPHFLFNALSSVQNLMNKNDIDNANRYLGKFARLTRNVLENSDIISIGQEAALLDDYLQMEQLRFGFVYKIDIRSGIDRSNTEIPGMLLQPFVENAVKHGIGGLGREGHIEVSFLTEEHNLILNVKDNGKGFDPKNVKSGMGLSLSRERIDLLNTIYPENTLTLEMISSEKGTTITLTLKNWL